MPGCTASRQAETEKTAGIIQPSDCMGNGKFQRPAMPRHILAIMDDA